MGTLTFPDTKKSRSRPDQRLPLSSLWVAWLFRSAQGFPEILRHGRGQRKAGICPPGLPVLWLSLGTLASTEGKGEPVLPEHCRGLTVPCLPTSRHRGVSAPTPTLLFPSTFLGDVLGLHPLQAAFPGPQLVLGNLVPLASSPILEERVSPPLPVFVSATAGTSAFLLLRGRASQESLPPHRPPLRKLGGPLGLLEADFGCSAGLVRVRRGTPFS